MLGLVSKPCQPTPSAVLELCSEVIIVKYGTFLGSVSYFSEFSDPKIGYKGAHEFVTKLNKGTGGMGTHFRNQGSLVGLSPSTCKVCC